MKKSKNTVFVFLFFHVISISFAQNFGSMELKKLNNAVVLLKEKHTKKDTVHNIAYEVGYRNIKTQEFHPVFQEFIGTGFIINVENYNNLIVTAKHVAENLTDNSLIKFQAAIDTFIPLKYILDLVEGKRWYYPYNSDIAIGYLNRSFSENNIDTLNSISREIKPNEKGLFFNTDTLNKIFYIPLLESTLDKPFRECELLVIGFSPSLNDDFNPSTISKFVYSSSEMLFDENGIRYFLIDNPSIEGFSGAFVFGVPKGFEFKDSTFGLKHFILGYYGMVNGTISDETGGKYTKVISSYHIFEAIKNSYYLEYTVEHYHTNGRLWQQVKYKENKALEVICNFDAEGKALDKGTLNNGNGTIKYYNEKNELLYTKEYKDGILVQTNFENKKN